jgi:hypothetical protein
MLEIQSMELARIPEEYEEELKNIGLMSPEKPFISQIPPLSTPMSSYSTMCNFS